MLQHGKRPHINNKTTKHNGNMRTVYLVICMECYSSEPCEAAAAYNIAQVSLACSHQLTKCRTDIPMIHQSKLISYNMLSPTNKHIHTKRLRNIQSNSGLQNDIHCFRWGYKLYSLCDSIG